MAEVFATLSEGETSDVYSLLSLIPQDLLPPTLLAVHSRFGLLLGSASKVRCIQYLANQRPRLTIICSKFILRTAVYLSHPTDNWGPPFCRRLPHPNDTFGPNHSYPPFPRCRSHGRPMWQSRSRPRPPQFRPRSLGEVDIENSMGQYLDHLCRPFTHHLSSLHNKHLGRSCVCFRSACVVMLGQPEL
jgi:hypothetical protein